MLRTVRVIRTTGRDLTEAADLTLIEAATYQVRGLRRLLSWDRWLCSLLRFARQG